MNENRISDYFVVSGVPENDRQHKSVYQSPTDPIVDIAVINRSNYEPVPSGYECIERTPGNHEANLSRGTIQGSKFFLCFKRGRDKPPLLDIGVFHSDSTDIVSPECNVVKKTPSGFPANLNSPGSAKIYLTYRRSSKLTHYNQLVVTNICVISNSKKETPPQAFCLIDKSLNKGYFGYSGSDVYLCYKKSMDRPPQLLYNPVIIDRFPIKENPQYPLPPNLPLFCLPMGASIECWPKNDPIIPSLSTFILTTNVGTKIYGTLLNFYEKIPPEILNDEELLALKFVTNVKENREDNIKEALKTKSLHRIKSICILSQWPFFDQFKTFLQFIYYNFIKRPSNVSLELYVFHFMKSIPFPSPDRPNILVHLGSSSHEDLLFSQKFDDFPIPSNGASFKKLLQNLGPDNCLHLLLFMLTEQKILFHSLRLSILTELAEALVAMIFPFNWNCPYIPLCPLDLAGVLNAPLPFIVGIYSQYFDYFEPPPDVISIDLDTRAIYLSETKKALNLELLPQKETRFLKERLEDIYKKIEMSNRDKVIDIQARRKFEKQIETEIQEAFLIFMALILRDFQHFLKPITAAPRVGATDPTTLFDFDGFLQKHKANISFYQQMTRTQMFTKFIEERSLVSDKNISLAFFDDCVEKVEKYEKMNLKRISKLNLINFEDRAKSSKTVCIWMPSLIQGFEQQELQSFNGHFNKELFHKLETDNPLNVVDSINPISLLTNNDCMDSASFESELQSYIFAKRAKHEVLKALKIAQQSSRSPNEWAKCLLINAYSLWFTHFPTFSHWLLSLSKQPEAKTNLKTIIPLSIAYQALQRMQNMDFSVPDEFCYRILMILCRIHNRPALAVKIFLDMKKYKVRLNAITYGYYNKAVLEGNWPISNAKWIKLSNVMRVFLHFQRHIKPTNESIFASIRSIKLFTEKPVIVDHCPSAGLLWITDRISQPNHKHSKNSIIEQHRRRHKSGDPIYPYINKDDFTKLEENNKHYNHVQNNIEFIKSETVFKKESTPSESSIKDGSEDDVSLEKNIFSNSFVTPIKETIVNMDFSKSPVADKLRSSFRIAKNFTKSKYSFARSTLYDSEKSLNKVGSLFVKSDTANSSAIRNNNSIRTPPRLPRSSTLPQSFTSTPINETMTSKSQFQNYGMSSPSDYFYSTMKSMSARLNEFKLSLGTSGTNSPVKFNVMNAVTSRLNFKTDEENLNQSIDNLLDAFDENSFHMEKYQNILNEYYNKPLDSFVESDEQCKQIVLTVEMISCTTCRGCNWIIYDEEIMSQWFAEDSNLNTKCIHCGILFVPSLTVYIKDFRNGNQIGRSLDPISVPYLSPLVLRKELENILNTESYSSLIRPKFVDDHPIVYWNLIWYFTRLNLPSHIGGLVLSASTLNSTETIEMNSKKSYDFNNVSVICMWDNEKFYETTPLHQKWLKIKNTPPEQLSSPMLDFKNLCEELIELIKEKDLAKPISFLISERSKLQKKLQQEDNQPKTKLNSLYRELMFLNLMQQPPALDADIFDQEYRTAFKLLVQKDKESLESIDNPLPIGAIYCRNLFKQLALIRPSNQWKDD